MCSSRKRRKESGFSPRIISGKLINTALSCGYRCSKARRRQSFPDRRTPGERFMRASCPCLPVVAKGKAPYFEGIENGGRMVLFGDHQLLLTVGDHGLNGWASNTKAAQDLSGAYGKTILIDVSTGSSEIFSLGHRNPQGLFIASSGAVWSTEHGPRGTTAQFTSARRKLRLAARDVPASTMEPMRGHCRACQGRMMHSFNHSIHGSPRLEFPIWLR